MKKVAIYGSIAAAAVAYNSFTSADRDETGTIVSAGSLDPFAMQVGDCFNDIDYSGGGDSGEISSVPGVPCGEPHDNEVFALVDLDGDTFPGDEAMPELAFNACQQKFEAFVGKDYDSSVLEITTMYPTESTWKQNNDREVVCAVYDMNMEKLTGTAKGSGI